jgi:putative ABC transport system permease protein
MRNTLPPAELPPATHKIALRRHCRNGEASAGSAMNNSIQTIPLANLALAFIPVAIVILIIGRWSLHWRSSLYAVIRMLTQLLLIGYLLIFIFASDSALFIMAILVFMMLTSSWIALATVRHLRPRLYWKSLVSVVVGGGATLLLITQGVIVLEPWFLPRYMIPLAGMIFATALNSVSLAAERFYAEISRDLAYEEARRTAFRASLIPISNSFLAVGLVSLPGMMTGQILSGISPLIAARYQIMVMCMLFGAAGISSACFLLLLRAGAGKQQA